MTVRRNSDRLYVIDLCDEVLVLRETDPIPKLEGLFQADRN